MTTPASRPRAGVSGWPVAHSRSPLIHRFWLERLGVDGDYVLLPVPPGEFPAFAAGIGAAGLVGANVTVPHKEAAFAACDRRTPTAEALGAVNVLWREDGRLWGDNTDVAGFLANMDDLAPGWDERRGLAVVIGAGGAARAIVYGLIARGFERIVLVNRTRSRAEALATAFAGPVLAAPWEDLAGLLGDASLLVNASVLGMAGQPPLVLDVGALPPGAVVSDIVYVPLRTPLVEAAAARGLRAVDGLGMLLHQAAPAFERWFGRRPTVTPELRAVVEADVTAKERGR